MKRIAGKSNMSIETAEAIGVALGIWAAEEILKREHPARVKTWAETGNVDCVFVEESEVWAGLHLEWFGNGHVDPDKHVNSGLYHACCDAMYNSARGELKRRTGDPELMSDRDPS